MLLRAAGYRRRAVLVGSGKHIEDVHTRSSTRSTRRSTCSASSRSRRGPDNGLRSLGPDRGPRRGARRATACRRSSSPTRTSRRSGRSSSSTSATGAGSPCGSRRRRWRSSSTARSSCPARRCRCSSCARRCSTASTTSSSARSTSSARCSCCSLLSPLLLAIAVAVVRHLARPGALPLDPAGHRRRAVRVLQVPHDALGRRPDAGRPRVAQRGLRRAVQDPPRPAPDARRPASCAATRSTSCRSCSTSSAGRCRSSARGRCPSATSTSSRTGTRSATSCCPGMTGLWQVSGRSELDFDDLVRLDFLYLERWSVGLDLTILLKTIPRGPEPARRLLILLARRARRATRPAGAHRALDLVARAAVRARAHR